ncbi:hypothetical protein H2509_06205 [Stappia sp. F7233]|uniref:Uncharacterized protein n=1 Tax=Stappia albiluteola TaxID=2758565 RepID=A0A839ACG0_9HYPH|nr:hypothetical protein [Stappia albiluteola]MBA5776718.1 hypothetical protein [Stappia albiluteola]
MSTGTTGKIALLLLTGAMTTFAAAAASAVDCTCRFRGSDYNLGDTVCLKTANGLELAQCQMVLNNTSWKFLSEQCPVGELEAPVPLDANETPAFSPVILPIEARLNQQS